MIWRQPIGNMVNNWTRHTKQTKSRLSNSHTIRTCCRKKRWRWLKCFRWLWREEIAIWFLIYRNSPRNSDFLTLFSFIICLSLLFVEFQAVAKPKDRSKSQTTSRKSTNVTWYLSTNNLLAFQRHKDTKVYEKIFRSQLIKNNKRKDKILSLEKFIRQHYSDCWLTQLYQRLSIPNVLYR